MNVTEQREGEPLWDDVCFYRCAFRPHIQGDLVNLWTTVPLVADRASSAALFSHCATEIARWLTSNKSLFGPGDSFQIVIGWPLSVRDCSRQVVKTGGDWKAIECLAEEKSPIELRRGWDAGLFSS